MADCAGVVADTHIFVWYVINSRRLSAAAGAALDAAAKADLPVLLSAVSLVELRYLVEKGTFTDKEYGVPLVTADKRLRDLSTVETIW